MSNLLLFTVNTCYASKFRSSKDNSTTRLSTFGPLEYWYVKLFKYLAIEKSTLKMYEMLVGQSPFHGEGEDELFDSILNERPYFPKSISKEAAKCLSAVRIFVFCIESGKARARVKAFARR